jgi:hypothetical protein
MNNFQLLEQELAAGKEKNFTKIKNDINDTRGLFQMIGDIVEHFFPKFVETFVTMSSGDNNPESNKPKYPHEN